MNRIRRISTIAAALVLGLAVPATAKLALTTAGEKCKKDAVLKPLSQQAIGTG